MLQGDLPDGQPHQQATQEELGQAQEDTVLHTRYYTRQILARNYKDDRSCYLISLPYDVLLPLPSVIITNILECLRDDLVGW